MRGLSVFARSTLCHLENLLGLYTEIFYLFIFKFGCSVCMTAPAHSTQCLLVWSSMRDDGGSGCCRFSHGVPFS